MNVKLLLRSLMLLFFGLWNAQQITLDTSLVSDTSGTIDEWWYWSGGFPVLGTGFTPNSKVTVFATDPSGKRWRDFEGTADSEGKFSIQISAKKYKSILGTHIVKATDNNGKTANANLTVKKSDNDIIPVSTNFKQLKMSQFFSFGLTVHASNIEPNAQVIVHLFSPNESGSAITGQYYADENGEFTMTFNGNTPTFPWGDTMPDIAGKWRINVEQFQTNYYGATEFTILPDNPNPQSYDPINKVDNMIPATPITRFEVNGTGYNTDPNSSSFYEDMSNKVFDLQAGQTYNVKIKGKNRSSFAPDTYTLFIDWNHNGILDEDNEITSEGYIFGSTGVDDKFTEFPITIPQNAINGNTRVRVLKMQSVSAYSMFWPTGASGYYYNSGQAEDYTFNITNGMDNPGCDFACPADINANTNPGGTTAKVTYELPFTCSGNSTASCSINYPSNNFQNSVSFSNVLVANDFIVPAGQTMKVNKIVPNFVRFSYGTNVYIYKDNNGQPGELVKSFENLTYEFQNQVGTASNGFAVYEVSIKLPETVELQSGKYWVAMQAQGPLVSWEAKTYDGTTSNTYISGNSGNNWTVKDGLDGVFKVYYECAAPAPTVVLVQGAESGSDFPIGDNVIVHNLVKDGVIIDTCVFNIHVKEVLATTETSKSIVKIYPNPVDDKLTIESDHKISKIEVFDMSGKKVMEQETDSKSSVLNTIRLPKGNYILKTNDGKANKSFKIMKK
ncbi:T9SS type A sorting domain-containing protein [Epilithonimonas mollis]|uniref:Por secretion system C-terminal sorting domain-containing protein n=1 Tax=Epilithonimonas mollis TaxID=216903 RepID=A0A1M6RTS8_9FLAO|nr:T9SS type A sorting domain-containing protein [Epilithonimonas mollis]SHK35921.1 Por secretion system C-terminal sorting domain-containing protein [Epilithonimonas mollis]